MKTQISPASPSAIAAHTLSSDLTQYFANDHHTVICAQKLEARNAELLAGLCDMVEASDYCTDELALDRALTKARAAIAKARQ